MAGNNSCGGRSLRYGTMRDNVISIDAMLADGTKAHFGAVDHNLSGLPADSPLALLARDLIELGAREAAEVALRFPKVQRRVGGYNLDALLPDGRGYNLAHILVGSEGTLAYSTRDRAQALAADRQEGDRRLPFRQLLRGDGCRPAPREAQAHRGGTGRPRRCSRWRARSRCSSRRSSSSCGAGRKRSCRSSSPRTRPRTSAG